MSELRKKWDGETSYWIIELSQFQERIKESAVFAPKEVDGLCGALFEYMDDIISRLSSEEYTDQQIVDYVASYRGYKWQADEPSEEQENLIPRTT